MNQVRNSAKAIIIQNGKLLTIKYIDAEGEWFTLPGGGQGPGETLIQDLKRECLEELGVEVEVGPLRYIREYIGKNHEFADHDFDAHQIEYMFISSLAEDLPDMEGINPDPGQVGIAWLPIEGLTSYRLYPKYLRSLFLNENNLSGSGISWRCELNGVLAARSGRIPKWSPPRFYITTRAQCAA